MRMPYEPPEIALLGSVPDLTQMLSLGLLADGLLGSKHDEEESYTS